MDKKIGFIGCGNMGKAILGGMTSGGVNSGAAEFFRLLHALNHRFNY